MTLWLKINSLIIGFILLLISTLLSTDVQATTASKVDFDGDGKADIAVRRPSSQYWYVLNSSGTDYITQNQDGVSRKVFGKQVNDVPVIADFDGDGKADLAVRRPSNSYWYILNSSGVDPITNNSDGITRKKFGSRAEDIPVVADFDGDGKADLAVRRPSTQYWYILNSSGIDPITNNADGITRKRFGSQQQDIPVVADYDGDGKADLAVRRPSTHYWYILNSSGTDSITHNQDGITRKQFGMRMEDIPVAADYDGDGKADIAVRRPSNYTWYILNSSGNDPLTNHADGISRKAFGKHQADIAVPADYDGDGKADIAVRRPNSFYWYIANSSGVDHITQNSDGISRRVFGKHIDDIPLTKRPELALEKTTPVEPDNQENDSLIGSWKATQSDNDLLTFTFFEDGTYLHAEVDLDDNSEISGMEWGEYNIDPQTKRFNVTRIIIDKNGDTGATDFAQGTSVGYISVENDLMTLSFDDDKDGQLDGELTFTRINSSDQVVGTWVNRKTENELLAFIFMDDGTYIHAEVDNQDSDEISGMEWGTYSISSDNNQLNATQNFDGNGDTGLTDIAQGIASSFVNVNGNLLTLSFDDNNDGNLDGSLEFTRVGAVKTDAKPDNSLVVGSWYETGMNTHMVLFKNGDFLYAENDQQQPSGLELGTYSYNPEQSKLTFNIDYDGNGPGQDSGIGDSGNPIDLVVSVHTDNAIMSTPNNHLNFSAADFIDSPISGVWRAANQQVFLILYQNGDFLYAENDAEQPNGLELGTYSYNADNQQLTFDITYDDNGPGEDSGMGDIGTPVKVSAVLSNNNNSISLAQGSLTLDRSF